MTSLRGRILNLGLRCLVKRRLEAIDGLDAGTAQASRRNLERLLARLPRPPAGIEVSPVDAGGVPGEWVRAASGDPQRLILYLHGGAYALGSARLYRDLTWRLAEAARASVLVLDYRLAPEHPFPAAVEDAGRAWRWLLEGGADPRRSLIAGDSAGGGLALATLLAARDAGVPLPAAAACFSPWTDLSASGWSVAHNAAADPFLVARLLRPAAELYLAGRDPRTPLASPLFADLAGLPPLLLHVGSSEILLGDSTTLAHLARAAGVDVELHVWERMPHAFPLFARGLPEGRRAIAELGRFAGRCLAGA